MKTTITYKTAMSKLLWIVLAAFLCLPTIANAEEGFSDNELDTLVSTIALYPDPLLVHVLTAATYGDQIPSASAWAQAHKNLNGEALATAMENANLSFDPSVQALIPFPTVLATMAKYRTWSDQLGDAVSFQKDQVLDAIQRMRQVAYNYGHLKSDDQVVVTKEERIIIEPTRTEYVYVPVYNPHVVYYAYADHYHPAVVYHHHAWLGTWYGEWGWGSCWFDWHYRYIYVRDYRWYPHRKIPHHPRRYNPPPRKHHHYRHAPAPSRHKAVEPGRRDDRHGIREGLKHRRIQEAPRRDDHRAAPRHESARRPEPAKDVHSRAAAAKSNSYSIVRDRDSRRVEPPKQEAKPRREERAESSRRESSRRESSSRSYNEPSKSSNTSNSSSRSTSSWDDNSSRSSAPSAARAERRSNSSRSDFGGSSSRRR